MTLYVVGGYMRSGTSAMMHGLQEGGMLTLHRHPPEVVREMYKARTYDPQMGGPYELPLRAMQQADFPDGMDGYLIKALGLSVHAMKPQAEGLRVVWMRRDLDEEIRSLEDYFGTAWDPVFVEWIRTAGLYYAQNRRDTEVTIVEYADLMESPVATFEGLRDFGFPVDPEKAAESLDVGYYYTRALARARAGPRPALAPTDRAIGGVDMSPPLSGIPGVTP